MKAIFDNTKRDFFQSLVLLACTISCSAISPVAALAAGPQTPTNTSSALKGRIESRGAANRLARPAMPSLPVGNALDGLVESAGDLKAGIPTRDKPSPVDVIHKSDFQLELMKSGQSDPTEKLAAELDAKDNQLAWEAWHKAFCELIQHHWVRHHRVPPGDAKVTVKVTHDGRVQYAPKTYSYHLAPGEDTEYPGQDEEFASAIAEVLRSAEFNSTLAFPKKSQRKYVSFTASFKNGKDLHEGYDWKKGDYGRIPSR